jgi:hypothetical protein
MKHTWADPKTEWGGFRLTRYWLDSAKIAGLPLTQQRNPGPEVQALFWGKALTLFSKIHRLLWVLIVLVGLILFRLWK